MIGQLEYLFENLSINLNLGPMRLYEKIVWHTVRTIVYPCYKGATHLSVFMSIKHGNQVIVTILS